MNEGNEEKKVLKDDSPVWRAKERGGPIPEMGEIIRRVEGNDEFCFRRVDFEMS